jgi:nitric oxide reductase NorD protein
MSEPEELIIEGAHLATRFARRAWLQYGPVSSSGQIPLSRVRARLELFLTALFQQPIVVAACEPPAPVTWLSRLAHGHPPRCGDDRLLPATDGRRVYLPPALKVDRGEEDTLALYRLLAVQQTARLVRGTPQALAALDTAERRDWFLLAEAVTIDSWIATDLPGLVPILNAARAWDLARRTPGRVRVSGEPEIECRIRNVLAADPSVPMLDLPTKATPATSRAWAYANARSGQGRRAPVAPVWYWGRPLDSSSPLPAAVRRDEASPDSGARRPRVAEMRRRPRVRSAAEDEDDERAGTWVIRADEPQESVEDPFGLQRPADHDDQADPEGLGDSLSDLPEARVVRTPGQAREVLRSGDDPPRGESIAPAAVRRTGVSYPEWDYRAGIYRCPGAVVREPDAPLGDAAWVSAALARHGRLARRVRVRFERLRPRHVWLDRQPDGSELDIDAFVTAAADVRAGASVDGRLYAARRPARRELAVALLVDVSASTDSWVSADRRIIDVEKEALLVVCEALDALGDPYGIFAFSGEGPEEVSVLSLKAFHDRSSPIVRRRIAALDSDRYTRIGAAVRHVTVPLCRETSERRLLLILSDGKPNDADVYEGRYGIEDTRQAVAEARRQGVSVFCLTIDREAPHYAPRIFGRAGFAVLRSPAQLPAVIIEALRHLIT